MKTTNTRFFIVAILLQKDGVRINELLSIEEEHDATKSYWTEKDFANYFPHSGQWMWERTDTRATRKHLKATGVIAFQYLNPFTVRMLVKGADQDEVLASVELVAEHYLKPNRVITQYPTRCEIVPAIDVRAHSAPCAPAIPAYIESTKDVEETSPLRLSLVPSPKKELTVKKLDHLKLRKQELDRYLAETGHDYPGKKPEVLHAMLTAKLPKAIISECIKLGLKTPAIPIKLSRIEMVMLWCNAKEADTQQRPVKPGYVSVYEEEIRKDHWLSIRTQVPMLIRNAAVVAGQHRAIAFILSEKESIEVPVVLDPTDDEIKFQNAQNSERGDATALRSMPAESVERILDLAPLAVLTITASSKIIALRDEYPAKVKKVLAPETWGKCMEKHYDAFQALQLALDDADKSYRSTAVCWAPAVAALVVAQPKMNAKKWGMIVSFLTTKKVGEAPAHAEENALQEMARRYETRIKRNKGNNPRFQDDEFQVFLSLIAAIQNDVNVYDESEGEVACEINESNGVSSPKLTIDKSYGLETFMKKPNLKLVG